MKVITHLMYGALFAVGMTFTGQRIFPVGGDDVKNIVLPV